MNSKACPRCGKQFEAKYATKVYCSNICRKKAARKRSKKKEREKEKRLRAARGPLIKTCITCSESFVPGGNSAKYCSDKCRPWIKPPRPKKPKRQKLSNSWRNCIQCGREYFSSNQTKTCSQECRNKRARDYRFRNYPGLTADRFEEMMSQQKEKCLICEERKKLVVDHCHANGHVRGLLCSNCNSAIGFLGDNISRLENAILYLRERGTPQ